VCVYYCSTITIRVRVGSTGNVTVEDIVTIC